MSSNMVQTIRPQVKWHCWNEKPHACGANAYDYPVGDIKLLMRYTKCGRGIMMSRFDFNKRLKKFYTQQILRCNGFDYRKRAPKMLTMTWVPLSHTKIWHFTAGIAGLPNVGKSTLLMQSLKRALKWRTIPLPRLNQRGDGRFPDDV